MANRFRQMRFWLPVLMALLLAFSSLGGMSAQETARIVGYHDFDAGDVRSCACSAGGSAVDPDNPDEDVLDRIRVDGVQVGESFEDAIVSHFSADIVVRVISPLLAGQ